MTYDPFFAVSDLEPGYPQVDPAGETPTTDPIDNPYSYDVTY